MKVDALSESEAAGPLIRPCGLQDRAAMLRVINAAAEDYRGVIPTDRFHEPYMPDEELHSEITAGVEFFGYDAGGLAGVMGVQAKANVDLIRHAYVLPAHQGRGVGSALLAHLRGRTARPILIGTWRAADWAILFYQRHGFTKVHDDDVAPLLTTYWSIPARQVETSTVLSAPALGPGDAAQLIAGSRQGSA